MLTLHPTCNIIYTVTLKFVSKRKNYQSIMEKKKYYVLQLKDSSDLFGESDQTKRSKRGKLQLV